jgi:hypothetical protein
MKNYKWWQDNERYIPDPWDEIAKFEQELKQMAITESALRESLTELSRESLSYRHQIETENKKYLEILTRWRDVMVEWYAEVDAYGMREPNISAGLVNDTNAAVAESIRNKS